MIINRNICKSQKKRLLASFVIMSFNLSVGMDPSHVSRYLESVR
ncbi:hypothetical protein AI2905V1_1762 [Enterobacter cloacae]|nr:hypothetical protein AI2905V1_1762 [Enterobacter cloacae]CAH5867416.1 hypothetical protein AI2905V1_1762 [Enterobacter cloacae]CAH5891168.1 hypothetical protein AI2916V1_2578 [Enterobacter cloacae]